MKVLAWVEAARPEAGDPPTSETLLLLYSEALLTAAAGPTSALLPDRSTTDPAAIGVGGSFKGERRALADLGHGIFWGDSALAFRGESLLEPSLGVPRAPAPTIELVVARCGLGLRLLDRGPGVLLGALAALAAPTSSAVREECRGEE